MLYRTLTLMLLTACAQPDGEQPEWPPEPIQVAQSSHDMVVMHVSDDGQHALWLDKHTEQGHLSIGSLHLIDLYTGLQTFIADGVSDGYAEVLNNGRTVTFITPDDDYNVQLNRWTQAGGEQVISDIVGTNESLSPPLFFADGTFGLLRNRDGVVLSWSAVHGLSHLEGHREVRLQDGALAACAKDSAIVWLLDGTKLELDDTSCLLNSMGARVAWFNLDADSVRVRDLDGSITNYPVSGLTQPTWSADGSTLALRETHRERRLHIVNVQEGTRTTALTHTIYHRLIEQNGTWLAWTQEDDDLTRRLWSWSDKQGAVQLVQGQNLLNAGRLSEGGLLMVHQHEQGDVWFGPIDRVLGEPKQFTAQEPSLVDDAVVYRNNDVLHRVDETGQHQIIAQEIAEVWASSYGVHTVKHTGDTYRVSTSAGDLDFASMPELTMAPKHGLVVGEQEGKRTLWVTPAWTL